MIYKIKDGDIIKILPFVSEDNSVTWVRPPVDIAYLRNTFVYDSSGKFYIKRIFKDKRGSWTTRYAFNSYVNGEIRVIQFSRTIYDMIIENYKNSCNLKDNYHLFINIELINGKLEKYDKSVIKPYDWNFPIADINSGRQWGEWIKENQPDYNEYLRRMDIFNNIQILVDEFGTDNALAEIISEDREKKLKTLLN